MVTQVMVMILGMQLGALQVIEKDQQYTTALAQFECITQGSRSKSPIGTTEFGIESVPVREAIA